MIVLEFLHVKLKLGIQHTFKGLRNKHLGQKKKTSFDIVNPKILVKNVVVIAPPSAFNFATQLGNTR